MRACERLTAFSSLAALAAALGTLLATDPALARMGGMMGGGMMGGPRMGGPGPGAFNASRPMTPAPMKPGPMARPRLDGQPLGNGIRSGSTTAKSTHGKSPDRAPSMNGGKSFDRLAGKPPRNTEVTDRANRRPHRPFIPVPIGVVVPVDPPVDDVPVDVVPANANGGTLPPINNAGNTAPPPSRPGGGNATSPGVRAIGAGVPPAGERRYIPDEVVIEIAGSPSPDLVEQLVRKHRLARLEAVGMPLTNSTFYRWRIPDRRSVPEVVRALEAEASVRSAQPNYISVLQQDRARAIDPSQYVFSKLQLLQTHALATGDNVLVAVIDSGIDGSHPELEGVVADSFDAILVGAKVHPHGTATAGAIVARAKLMGIAPAARILAVRAFAPDAKGEGTSFAVLKGLDWAANRGARVINMSFAGPRDPAMLRAIAAARARGIVLVAAAGNAGPKSPPLFPAADPNVIAVTATDADDQLYKGANWGPYIAISAPGVDLLLPRPNSGYQVTTGTSFSAAAVSGAVALLLERKPNLTPDDIRRILMSTARDLGPKGFDNQFGAGLIDVYQAVLSLGNQEPAEVAATSGQGQR